MRRPSRSTDHGHTQGTSCNGNTRSPAAEQPRRRYRDTGTASAVHTTSLCQCHRQRELFTSDNGGGICFCPYARVRLSVCVQDYLKTRAWIWMKCCVNCLIEPPRNILTYLLTYMEELINFRARWYDPDHSLDAGTGFLSPAATRQRGILLRRENTMHVLVLGARRSSNAWFWGVERPLSGVNALYRVHF